MRANANTGLSSPDVFYVGNLIADTGAGSGTAPFRVNVLDLAAVRGAMGTAAAIASPCDFNRDGRVSPLDLAIVRSAQHGSLAALSAPALGAPASAAAMSPPTADRILTPDDEDYGVL